MSTSWQVPATPPDGEGRPARLGDDPQAAPPLWVVGAGGLLGAAVVRTARLRGQAVMTSAVPWPDPLESTLVLRRHLREFVTRAGAQPWHIAWCAGAGVVATPTPVLNAELDVLRRFADDLADAADGVAPGAIFLASSAGGLYAGSPGGHYDESSVVTPLAPYGRVKLAGEQAMVEGAGGGGVPVFVGRIANLYGPGQRLGKPQGVISQICAAHLSGQPSHIYVSLDTVRDYLYVDDAAAMILDALLGIRRRVAGQDDPAVVKILASGRAVTLGAVLAECRRVFKRAPRVVLSASARSAHQVLSLRFTSREWPELDQRELTGLPVGISRTLASLRASAIAPRLPALLSADGRR